MSFLTSVPELFSFSRATVMYYLWQDLQFTLDLLCLPPVKPIHFRSLSNTATELNCNFDLYSLPFCSSFSCGNSYAVFALVGRSVASTNDETELHHFRRKEMNPSPVLTETLWLYWGKGHIFGGFVPPPTGHMCTEVQGYFFLYIY